MLESLGSGRDGLRVSDPRRGSGAGSGDGGGGSEEDLRLNTGVVSCQGFDDRSAIPGCTGASGRWVRPNSRGRRSGVQKL